MPYFFWRISKVHSLKYLYSLFVRVILCHFILSGQCTAVSSGLWPCYCAWAASNKKLFPALIEREQLTVSSSEVGQGIITLLTVHDVLNDGERDWVMHFQSNEVQWNNSFTQELCLFHHLLFQNPYDLLSSMENKQKCLQQN